MKINDSILEKQTSRTVGLVLAILIGISIWFQPEKAHAQGGLFDVLYVYKVTKSDRTIDLLPFDLQRDTKRYSYFLIVNPQTKEVRTIFLYPGREFKIVPGEGQLSQWFISTDATNRSRLVVSQSGPGANWDFFNGNVFSRGEMETVVGRVKNNFSLLHGGAPIFRPIAPALRGKGRGEAASTGNVDGRQIKTTSIGYRFSKNLTNLVNSIAIANGNRLQIAQSQIGIYLVDRGYSAR